MGGSKDQFRIFFGSVIYCSKFNVLSDAIERIPRNDPISAEIAISWGWVGVDFHHFFLR